MIDMDFYFQNQFNKNRVGGNHASNEINMSAK